MFSFIMGVVAKGNIPANSYVCEFKTNLICDKATFGEKVKEYFYNNEVVTALRVKVLHDEAVFDCTRRNAQFGKYIVTASIATFQLTSFHFLGTSEWQSVRKWQM